MTRLALVALLATLAVGACSTGTPTAPPSIALPTLPPDPPITLSAPAQAASGAAFDVGWTGEDTTGDFLVIVPAGATTWTETADSPYVNATVGNPATLTAPRTAGSYEIWFLKGNLGTQIVIKARAPLTVT